MNKGLYEIKCEYFLARQFDGTIECASDMGLIYVRRGGETIGVYAEEKDYSKCFVMKPTDWMIRYDDMVFKCTDEMFRRYFRPHRREDE